MRVPSTQLQQLRRKPLPRSLETEHTFDDNRVYENTVQSAHLQRPFFALEESRPREGTSGFVETAFHFISSSLLLAFHQNHPYRHHDAQLTQTSIPW